MQESMKIQTSLIIKYFFKESVECFCNCTIILKFCINSCFDKLKIPQPICFIAYYLSIYLSIYYWNVGTWIQYMYLLPHLGSFTEGRVTLETQLNVMDKLSLTFFKYYVNCILQENRLIYVSSIYLTIKHYSLHTLQCNIHTLQYNIHKLKYSIHTLQYNKHPL